MRTLLLYIALWLGLSTTALAQPQSDPAKTQGAAPDEARLERPSPDQGYYYTAGLHLANATVVDEGDATSGLLGYALSFRIGQSVTSFFDLGIRADYGSVSADDRSGGFGGFGLDATLRPYGPWLVRLGVGLGGGKLSAAANSSNEAGVFGAIGALELGYSLFPAYCSGESGGFALTPLLRLTTYQVGSDDSAYFAMIGVDFTYWAGLPNNQLDLTLEEAFPRNEH